jgi:hypothetical protein
MMQEGYMSGSSRTPTTMQVRHTAYSHHSIGRKNRKKGEAHAAPHTTMLLSYFGPDAST